MNEYDNEPDWMADSAGADPYVKIRSVLESSTPILLYHGSLARFAEVDLTKCKRYKDFGVAFYTTVYKEHATAFATQNRERAANRMSRRNAAHPPVAYLYTYEANASLFRHFKTHVFYDASRDWLRYVIQNRYKGDANNGHDIVIGPTANDRVQVQVDDFASVNPDLMDNDRMLDALLVLVQAWRLPWQVAFKSADAVGRLVLKGCEPL